MELRHSFICAWLLLATGSLMDASQELRVDISVDWSTCKDADANTRNSLSQVVMRLVHNVTTFDHLAGVHCGCGYDNSSIARVCHSTKAIERFCFRNPNNDTSALTALNDKLRVFERYLDMASNGGYVCGQASFVSRTEPESEAQSSEDSTGTALGVGLGAGLAALAALVAAAALLVRKLKKKGAVDDADNAAGGAAGVTPVVNIDDAPNSVPPAGTG